MQVYFITAFHERSLVQVKIGYSKDPDARLRDLQTGSALKLKLWGTVPCRSAEHARQVEKLAHRLFHKQRRRGEWFHLSQSQMQALRNVVDRAANEAPSTAALSR